MGTISRITDAVADAVLEWQRRPLEESSSRWSTTGAIRVKVRVDHRVASRSAHIAVGAGHGRLSSTWLKYLGPGPGEGASLKGGTCAPVPAQPQGRQGRADRKGGTSRTEAKRAGECHGLTGLPEANAGSPGPRRRSRPAWSTRFRTPGCGSSPTGESRKVATALKADLHHPEPVGRLAGSDRLLRVRHEGSSTPRR